MKKTLRRIIAAAVILLVVLVAALLVAYFAMNIWHPYKDTQWRAVTGWRLVKQSSYDDSGELRAEVGYYPTLFQGDVLRNYHIEYKDSRAQYRHYCETDDSGRPVSQKNYGNDGALSSSYEYTYSDDGMSADVEVYKSGVDATERMKWELDERGNVIRAYDCTDGAEEKINEYEYTADGKLLKSTDARGTTQWTYSDDGALIEKKSESDTYIYTYNKRGVISKYEYITDTSGGFVIEYTHDFWGRLKESERRGSDGSVTLHTVYEYKGRTVTATATDPDTGAVTVTTETLDSSGNTIARKTEQFDSDGGVAYYDYSEFEYEKIA